MITARAPLRVSFGGGGTDLPAYYERFGGLVVSSAISAACHVQIERSHAPGIAIISRDYQQSIFLPRDEPVTVGEPLSLPRAVLSWFADRGDLPSGITMSLRADVPPGSGLGSSSAMAVALVSAVARAVDLPLGHEEIAEIACEVEIDILGRPIGRQDQYAAAMGGLNAISFSPAGVDVQPLRLPEATERSLEEHLILFSTRQTRDSAVVLKNQREASCSNEQVIQRLHRIKTIARSMAQALRDGSIPTFGRLLDESWHLKRGLAAGVTSSEIDRWYALARSLGVYGGKIAGAGGGGFFLFCVPPERRRLVSTALIQEGLTPLAVSFDRQGCHVHEELLVLSRRGRKSVKGTGYGTARAGRSEQTHARPAG